MTKIKTILLATALTLPILAHTAPNCRAINDAVAYNTQQVNKYAEAHGKGTFSGFTTVSSNLLGKSALRAIAKKDGANMEQLQTCLDNVNPKQVKDDLRSMGHVTKSLSF